MFLKRNCICGSCFRTFECTGSFSPDGDRYIKGAVAWMKILSKEPGKLLMEGSTLCTSCANPHHFIVEYDCVEDRYSDPYEYDSGVRNGTAAASSGRIREQSSAASL